MWLGGERVHTLYWGRWKGPDRPTASTITRIDTHMAHKNMAHVDPSRTCVCVTRVTKHELDRFCIQQQSTAVLRHTCSLVMPIHIARPVGATLTTAFQGWPPPSNALNFPANHKDRYAKPLVVHDVCPAAYQDLTFPKSACKVGGWVNLQALCLHDMTLPSLCWGL